jgi:multidrug efflux pump subunit AcrA (membrane-fusion protein)
LRTGCRASAAPRGGLGEFIHAHRPKAAFQEQAHGGLDNGFPRPAAGYLLNGLAQARLTFSRQQELLKNGWTPRANFDDAEQKLLTAQAQVDSAQAQARTAREQQSYTVLFADARGAVTAVGAEPGEVVRAGQMVVQLAREGGRDAVFDVPEQLIRNGPQDPVVEIALTNDPRSGRGRCVS